ncbi:MAG: hypothetical protein CL566_08540 [Alphaproteobacteria bacterium]|nr:hypothetical protein [Alphaproteobacteria bacterium]
MGDRQYERSSRSGTNERANTRRSAGCLCESQPAIASRGPLHDRQAQRDRFHFNADIIVIPAHRPYVGDYLLGSNAARVARHADQSVLIVR